MKTTLLPLILSGFLTAAAPAMDAKWLLGPPVAAEKPVPPTDDRPRVQLAVLLDTSNSMDGLIAQAKSQLWQIVNEFIAAKQDGKAPRVEVALYEYGNNSLSKETGFVRQVAPLTDDLDKISEALFALKTNGGEEWCGWVIRDAVRDLAWDKSDKTYKAIFIAGNEPFTQGPVQHTTACKTAIERGIIVNTIHCGDLAQAVQGGWKDGASLADGKFMTIDPNAQLAHIDAPQDKEIAALNEKLNRTYLAYGAHGAEGKARQLAQDAAAPAPAKAARAKTKASANYNNESWDLLDAVKNGKADLAKLKEAELPEEIRALPAAQRPAFIAAKQKEREATQKQLAELTAQRDRYVAEQTKAQSQEKRLDQAVTSAVREQAAKKAFVFEK
jgi:hypothetical protein